MATTKDVKIDLKIDNKSLQQLKNEGAQYRSELAAIQQGEAEAIEKATAENENRRLQEKIEAEKKLAAVKAENLAHERDSELATNIAIANAKLAQEKQLEESKQAQREKYEEEYERLYLKNAEKIARQQADIDKKYKDELHALDLEIQAAEAAENEKGISDEEKARRKADTQKAKDKKKEREKDIKDEKKAAEQKAKDAISAKAKKKSEKDQAREERDQRIADGTASKKDKLSKVAGKAVADSVGNAIGGMVNWVKSLESTMEDIAKTSISINTRLQGSKNKQSQDIFGKSYWKAMTNTMNSVAGASVFIKQADWQKNLTSMVDQGIAFNIEQRSFLQTLKDDIATTFNAADGTLLKLVRIQQQDTTAARLGMEASLNAFLNNMYETTEYLKDLAESVRSSLYEAEALMDASTATAFEYQVQKWSGSMYSVGMSSDAVGGIAGAVGKLAAGDLSALTDGGYGNLLVMAANQAGVSITEALESGLSVNKTNDLLEAVVSYLDKMYNDSSDSLVVQQQLAQVYGVKASDLKAAANLADTATMNKVASTNLDYGDMMSNLYAMANSIASRSTMATMMDNLKANMSYTMAASVANNPAMYMVWQMSNLLEDLTGGIALPMISVMGNTVDLHTTVADLIKVGALSTAAFQAGSTIISGLGNMGNGGGMLNTVGLSNSSNISSVARGTGTGTRTSGKSTSVSGYAGGGSGAQDKEMADAEDSSSAKLTSAKEEENTDIELKDVNDTIGQILALLQAAVDTDGAFKTSDDSLFSASFTIGGLFK